MRTVPLACVALATTLLGCGASVARFESDVPMSAVDAPITSPDAPPMDGGTPAPDAPSRPDLGSSTDVGAPIDLGVPRDVQIARDVGPGPMCTVHATRWNIDAGGTAATFEFTADGRWIVSAGDEVAATGVFAIEGDRVVLSGEMSGGSSCSPTDQAVFQLRFSPECERLQLALVHDDCTRRGEGIDRFRFMRL